MNRSLLSLPLLAALCEACQPKTVDIPPELAISPEELDFGSVPLESESTLTITIENTGGGDATLLSLTLTDGDPDVYTVDRNNVDTIGSGEEQTVLVTFRPDEQQLFTGQLQLRTDDLDEPSFFVSLLGRGGPSDEDYDGDGYSVAAGDCDDGNPYVHPGAEEVCDGIDNDCNSVRLPDEIDNDYDGWLVCEGDCDDANGSMNPGAEEICDGIDNNCDLITPDNDDLDLDGFTLCDGDCDDDAPQVNPERPEVCDGYDNDCDTNIDNVDNDLDGHTVCSAAGDCDDEDAYAYPVVVSQYGSSYGTGTDDDPYDSIALALDNLDAVCRTVVLEPGDYEVGETWSDGLVTFIGRTGVASDVTLQQNYYGERPFTVTVGASLVLRDLTIQDSLYGEDGGAISVTNASLTLDGVVLLGNESYNDGGAIAAVSSTLTLENGCRFEGNVAADDGGAMLLDASTVDDEGTIYISNDGIRGGALYIAGGIVNIDGSEFRTNNAGIEGGAVAAIGAGTLDLERSWFVLNQAALDGGALVLRDFISTGSLRNNRFQDNIAQSNGGGIAVIGASSAQIANNTLTGNEAVGGQGAAISILGTTATEMVLLSNISHSNDGASAFYAESVLSASHNTGYLTNSGVHFAGVLLDGYGLPVDATNLVRNPLFVALTDDGNPDNDDLGLQAGSPEIDTGPPEPEYNDTNGTQNDRGFSGGPGAQ